jgi:hypothetical protein
MELPTYIWLLIFTFLIVMMTPLYNTRWEGFSGSSAADPENRRVHRMMVLGHLPRVRLSNPFNPFIDVETNLPDNYRDNQYSTELVPWGESHLSRLEGFESNSKSGQLHFDSFSTNHSINSVSVPL